MSNYLTVALSEIGITVTGKTPLSEHPEDFGDEILFVTPSDSFDSKFINQTIRKLSHHGAQKLHGKILPANSILVTCIGSVGKVAINKKVCITNQQINSIILKASFHTDYIYYVLKNNYRLLRNRANGSTVLPLLNKTDFDSLMIKVHAQFLVQQKIADVLSCLDKKIELNNRINAELEAMAKTLYDYWFVQFDFPNEEGEPYKSSGGKMVYNSILKREIPLGWKTESILNNCNIIDCLHSKKPDLVWESENYYLLQLENILDNGLIDISEKYYVSQKDYFIWTSRIELKQYDIVMTNAGRTAAFAQIPNHINCGIGRNITAIRPINISPNYFFLSLSSIDIQRQILTSLDNGAFFKSFNVRGIKALQLLRPINKIEHKFEDTIKSIIDKRNLLVKENSELKKLRDWLLPMLMNGQVTVR